MSRFSILKDEITNDPLTRGYAGMTDQQVTDDINSEYRTIKEPVTSANILAWAGDASRYIKIKNSAEDTNKGNDIRSIAYAALDMIKRDGTDFDFNLPDRVAMLDALVADGTLDAADKTALENIANKTISRAAELGIGTVRIGEVTAARS